MGVKTVVERWAVVWHQLGHPDHVLFKSGESPMIYRTRRRAQAAMRLSYGYIATRKDLRRAPHHWRLPRIVKVRVRIDECSQGNS